jgi:hypothetical protein
MANLKFYSKVDVGVEQLLGSGGVTGSGLGFFGAGGFGTAVNIGSYQSQTYITDAAGTVEGPEIINNRYLTATSIQADLGAESSGIALPYLPNRMAVLNIRFTGAAAIVNNVTVTACERYTNTTNPVGVTVQAAEIANTSTVYTNSSTYSDSTWTNIHGTTTLSLQDSPGSSGTGLGLSQSDTRHDWYVALSIAPTSGGNKTIALYTEVEYIDD